MEDGMGSMIEKAAFGNNSRTKAVVAIPKSRHLLRERKRSIELFL
jgi:hypothetical protein